MDNKYVIQLNEIEFFKRFMADGSIGTVDDKLMAESYTLSKAQEIAENINKIRGCHCEIIKAGIECGRDLLEHAYNQIYDACDALGADITIDYGHNNITVCLPDGRTNYCFTLTREIITD